MNNNQEIEGTIHLVESSETKSGKTFVTLVIDTGGEYAQKVQHGRHGLRVNVQYNLRGREWDGKYYADLVAWKVTSIREGAPAPPPAAPVHRQAPPAPAPVQHDDDDDIPF